MLSSLNSRVKVLVDRVIPAWDGQAIVLGNGNLYSGRITRQLHLQLPAPQLVVPDLASEPAFIVPKLVLSLTPKEGFSGHVLVIDPACNLARHFEGLKEKTYLPEFDKATAQKLAEHAVHKRQMQPYLEFLRHQFELDLLTTKLMERRAVLPRLGPLYDYLNEGHELPTAAQAADLCALSSSRFSVLLHEDLGMSFPTYCSYLRLQRYMVQAAKAWRPVVNRAKGAGFHDISHLMQTFKRIVNVSLQDVHGVRFHEDEMLLSLEQKKFAA
jgi:AraC-like DNA-binding protein